MKSIPGIRLMSSSLTFSGNRQALFDGTSLEGWKASDVEAGTITIPVDGRVVKEFTEPDDFQPPEKFKTRRLSSGTVANHGHDPKSITYYRDINVHSI